MYNYTCYHIKGDENVWADLLGRWSAPNTVRRIVQIPELPSSSDPEFIWPDLREIEAIQRDNKINQPEGLKAVDTVLYTDSGAIWIPNSSTDLQLRLCIIAHTGTAGHRGRASTEMVLKKSYFWSTLSTDVENFVRACIHCLSTV